MNELLALHRTYIAKLRAAGAPIRRLKTPCCGKELEVTVPTSKREQWDSLFKCPYCQTLFMKISTNDKAIGRMPLQ